MPVVRRPRKSRRELLAELDALPEGVNAEIIHGELVVSPRPAVPHARASTVLTGFLSNSFGEGIGGPGGWWILHEPELMPGVDPDMEPLIPDIAGWRVERMSELMEVARVAVVPDWVCEVLSPSTEAMDRADKMPYYARLGVRHAWLVDPILETLEVFRLDGDGWRVADVHRGVVTVAVEPFEAVPLELGRLWKRSTKAPPAPEGAGSQS